MTETELEALALARGGTVTRCSLPPAPPPAGCNEEQFQQCVIDAAHHYGWRVAHFRSVRVQRKDGTVYWQTPAGADGVGWPDLFLVKGCRAIAAELKVKRNRPTEEQLAWLTALAKVPGIMARVYYPRDWEQIIMLLSNGD